VLGWSLDPVLAPSPSQGEGCAPLHLGKDGQYLSSDWEWQPTDTFTVLPSKNPSRWALNQVCAPTRSRDTAGSMNVYLERWWTVDPYLENDCEWRLANNFAVFALKNAFEWTLGQAGKCNSHKQGGTENGIHSDPQHVSQIILRLLSTTGNFLTALNRASITRLHLIVVPGTWEGMFGYFW
jgi:hypothetical protein